jgi:hypothetical protein
MSDNQTDRECTVRFSSFRGECHAAHANGSGAWIGKWHDDGDAAQADCDTHDQAHHGGNAHAKVEFK